MAELQKLNNRNVIYDVIKAIGIIAIVIGHCHPNADVVRFVYGFHLAIFFFVSGLQFNDKKYANEPFLLLQNRVKSMWPSFFCYMTFFTLTYNISVKIHILAPSELLGENAIFSKVVNNFFFYGGETLGGAMWFVPMMLAGIIIFSAILYFSAQFAPRFRVILTVLLCLGLGIIGVIAAQRKYHYLFFSQVSFLLIPLMLLGYLVSLRGIDFKKLLKLPVFIVILALFVFFTVIKDYGIELSQAQIVSPYLFYPITLCGIYAMCYLAKIFSAIKYVSTALSFIGKYSFDIMALHFIIFKFVDLIAGLITKAPVEVYSVFPRAYPQLWPIYLVLSLAVSPFVRIGAGKIYCIVKSFCGKIFAVKQKENI